MRASPKATVPFLEPHKPVKVRIADAAERLFLQFGMNVNLLQIAHFAGTPLNLLFFANNT
jgi:hypothetical protein